MSQVFSFESHKVRTITQNGQPWFAGRDIALLLGYAQPEKEVRRVCKHVELLKSTNLVEFKISPAGLLIIPESDVWRLVIRSTLPKAQQIEEWIMSEVLPAIRKNGRYEAQPKALPQPEQIALPTAEADIRRQIDGLYFRLKMVTREAFDIQRDIFSLVRQSMGPCMRTPDRRRTAVLKAYATHESLSYAHDRTLEALVANAETLMVVENMA